MFFYSALYSYSSLICLCGETVIFGPTPSCPLPEDKPAGQSQRPSRLQFPALSIQSKIWCFYWSSTIVFCLSMPYYRFFGCDFLIFTIFFRVYKEKSAFWWQFSSFSVPHVRIQGAPDLHVDQGSVINLTCIISYSPEPPVYVFWYRGDKVGSTLSKS